MEIFWMRPSMARFRYGDKIEVVAWANMRLFPGYVGKPATDLLTVLKPGTIVTVGNNCMETDGLTWWLVSDGQREGWVAEADQYGRVLLAEYDGSDWVRSITFVLKWEGGLSTDPHDPGGTTKYGISQRAYPDLDIFNLTIEQAKQIYFTDYWQAAGADKLSWPLCLAHLDFAVNAGVGQAQRILSASEFNFERYVELRREFYCNLSQFDRYGMAWLRRVDDLVKVAQ